MAKLDKREVERIARLADLKVNKKEVESYSNQLTEIVSFFDELNEVETENVEPTSQTTGLVDVTRRDRINVDRILPPESALSNAKKKHNNYFLVGAVLDKENS